jgi:hypothetical protein
MSSKVIRLIKEVIDEMARKGPTPEQQAQRDERAGKYGLYKVNHPNFTNPISWKINYGPKGDKVANTSGEEGELKSLRNQVKTDMGPNRRASENQKELQDFISNGGDLSELEFDFQGMANNSKEAEAWVVKNAAAASKGSIDRIKKREKSEKKKGEKAKEKEEGDYEDEPLEFHASDMMALLNKKKVDPLSLSEAATGVSAPKRNPGEDDREYAKRVIAFRNNRVLDQDYKDDEQGRFGAPADLKRRVVSDINDEPTETDAEFIMRKVSYGYVPTKSEIETIKDYIKTARRKASETKEEFLDRLDFYKYIASSIKKNNDGEKVGKIKYDSNNPEEDEEVSAKLKRDAEIEKRKQKAKNTPSTPTSKYGDRADRYVMEDEEEDLDSPVYGAEDEEMYDDPTDFDSDFWAGDEDDFGDGKGNDANRYDAEKSTSYRISPTSKKEKGEMDAKDVVDDEEAARDKAEREMSGASAGYRGEEDTDRNPYTQGGTNIKAKDRVDYYISADAVEKYKKLYPELSSKVQNILGAKHKFSTGGPQEKPKEYYAISNPNRIKVVDNDKELTPRDDANYMRVAKDLDTKGNQPRTTPKGGGAKTVDTRGEKVVKTKGSADWKIKGDDGKEIDWTKRALDPNYKPAKSAEEPGASKTPFAVSKGETGKYIKDDPSKTTPGAKEKGDMEKSNEKEKERLAGKKAYKKYTDTNTSSLDKKSISTDLPKDLVRTTNKEKKESGLKDLVQQLKKDIGYNQAELNRAGNRGETGTKAQFSKGNKGEVGFSTSSKSSQNILGLKNKIAADKEKLAKAKAELGKLNESTRPSIKDMIRQVIKEELNRR